jgi:hypothetical protein
MTNLENNEMVLNFDELKKLSQFEQANVVWEIIEKLGFTDATMEPTDNGYFISLDCEEEEDTYKIIVDNIKWNYDEMDKILTPSLDHLPTYIEIDEDDFFSHFEEVADINEENIAIYLNEEYWTEPDSFTFSNEKIIKK